jgi:hypothetical protein
VAAMVGCAPAEDDGTEPTGTAESAVVAADSCDTNRVIDGRLWEWHVDARATASALSIRSTKLVAGDVEVYATYRDGTTYIVKQYGLEKGSDRAKQKDKWLVVPVGVRPGATYRITARLDAPIKYSQCVLTIST